MRQLIFLIFMLILMGTYSMCSAENPSIAVFPLFNTSQNSSESISEEIHSMIHDTVIESHIYSPIDKNRIKSILSEIGTQQINGASYENTMMFVTKKTRAMFMLSGTYNIEYRQGSDYVSFKLKIQIADAFKGVVYQNIEAHGSGYSTTEAINHLSNNLKGKIHEIPYGDLYAVKNNRKANVLVAIKAENITCAMEGHTKSKPVDLSFYNEKISDYHFLASQIERIMGKVNVNYQELGNNDTLYDLSPKTLSEVDAILFIKLTRGGKVHTFTRESEHFAQVNIECIQPKSLKAIGVSTLSTKTIKGKKYEIFPEIKSGLVESLSKEWKPFPFEF